MNRWRGLDGFRVAVEVPAAESTIERHASFRGQELLPLALPRLSAGNEAVQDI